MEQFFDQIFKDLVVAGVPLYALIIGVVQYLKNSVLLRGRLIALLAGVLLGGGYSLSVHGVPSDFSGWFAAFVVGLVSGLVSSGLYDAGKQLAKG